VNLLELPQDCESAAEVLTKAAKVRALRRRWEQPIAKARKKLRQPQPQPEPPPPAPPITMPKKRRFEYIPNFLALVRHGHCNPYYEPDEPRISVMEIVEKTAEYFGITSVSLMSKLRTRNFVDARHVAVYLAKKLTRSSYVQIGKRIGDLDHTSILHAVRRIQAKIDSQDRTIAEAVLTIERKVLE